MVVTRSMSGTTKKSDTKRIADEREERKSGATSSKEPVKCRYRTIKDVAFNIFMIKDYLQRYYEMYPPYPTKGLIPDEVYHPGILEWNNMSDDDKSLWIEFAKRLKDEGVSIFNWRRVNNI